MFSNRYETSFEKTGGISARPLLAIFAGLFACEAKQTVLERGPYNRPGDGQHALVGDHKVLATSDCAPGIQMRPILTNLINHRPSYPPLPISAGENCYFSQLLHTPWLAPESG